MAKNSIHVVPHEDGWAVKQENQEGVLSTHKRRADAIEAAEVVAKDGEHDLVLHRADGRFGKVQSYSELAGVDRSSKTDRGSDLISTHDLLTVGTRIRWSAIVAGLVVALVINILMGAAGVAMGLSFSGEVGTRTLGIFGAIWAALSLLVSLFVGGLVTTRSTVGEDREDAVVYGVLVWGSLILFLVFVGGQGLSGLGFGDIHARATTGEPAVRSAPADAGTPANNATATNRDTADAPSEAVNGAWWTFVTIVISLLAATGGAIFGAGPEIALRRYGYART